jgi:glucokinase
MNALVNNLRLITVADIGGTHITAGVYCTDGGGLLADSIVRREVDSNGSAESILEAFVSTLEAASSLVGLTVRALAIAMPGPFDYEHGISHIRDMKKYDSLYGLDLKQYFASHFKIHPSLVVFRNDAEAGIAGEVAALGTAPERLVLGLTLGTGFGSAISKGGDTRDANFCLEPFLDSIADDYFSTRWFVQRYRQMTGLNVTGVMGLVNEGATKVVEDIFEEFSTNLIAFLKPKIALDGIDELMICGNIAKAHRYFLPYLADSLKDVRITMGNAGENAGMLGAAAKFHRGVLGK